MAPVTAFTDNFDRTTLGEDWTAIHYDGVGSVSLDGSQVTIDAGSGGDFWSGTDGGSLIYHSIEAPPSDALELQRVVAEVKLTSLPATVWKRMFMLRAGIHASAANVCLLLNATGFFAFSQRAEEGSGWAIVEQNAVHCDSTKPIWMRLDCTGGSVYGFVKQAVADPWAFAARTEVPRFRPTMVCLTDSYHGSANSFDDFSLQTSVITVSAKALKAHPMPHIAQANPPSIYTLQSRTIAGSRSAGDQHFGGRGSLSGTTVDASSNPVSRKVLLYDRRANILLRSTWSKANGTYRFDDLDPTRTYVVLAHDYTGQYNAVVADNVTPEVA